MGRSNGSARDTLISLMALCALITRSSTTLGRRAVTCALCWTSTAYGRSGTCTWRFLIGGWDASTRCRMLQGDLTPTTGYSSSRRLNFAAVGQIGDMARAADRTI